MENCFNLPGLAFVGFVKTENVNHGDPLPLFEPVPQDGRESINTLDGWNVSADRQNRRSFLRALGRMPQDDTELAKWVESISKNPT